MKYNTAKDVYSYIHQANKNNPTVKKWLKRIIIGIIVFVITSLLLAILTVYLIIRLVVSTTPAITQRGEQLWNQGRTLIESQIQNQLGEQTQELKIIENQLKTIQSQLNSLTTPPTTPSTEDR